MFIRYFVNPILWRFIKRSRRFAYLEELRKKQWNGLQINKKKQAKKLYNLVKYAENNIPYYRDIIRNKKISYSRKTIFQDIKKLPVLTKEDIDKNFDSLINKNIKSCTNTSGGSTGKQVTFLQTAHMYDYDAATTSLSKEWAGRKEGELIIKLWGSERDALKGGSGWKGFLVRNFTNVILLNTYLMTEEDILNHISTINKKRPKILVAYADCAFEVAQFILDNNIKVYSPTAIITSAGTLFPKFRQIIQQAFQCPVFDRYGSREVGGVAFECNKHNGLHVNIFNHYVEILDNKLRDVKKEGAKGEIYVTSLHNYAMPLIRYRIEDIGQVTNKKCACGRGLPLIKKIEGRVGYTIRTKHSSVSSTALTTTFYYPKSIKRYQVIQNKNNFLIKIEVRDKRQWQKDQKELLLKLQKLLKGTKIEFRIVNKIHPTKSGKFLFFINENEIKQVKKNKMNYSPHQN